MTNINMNQTYLKDMSYWTPLEENNEENEEEEINIINKTPSISPTQCESNKWTR